jgi:hypothetical protein
LKALSAQLAQQALKVLLVRLVPQALKVLLVPPVRRVLRALLARRVPLVLKVLKALLAQQDRPASTDQQARPAYKVCVALSFPRRARSTINTKAAKSFFTLARITFVCRTMTQSPRSAKRLVFIGRCILL